MEPFSFTTNKLSSFTLIQSAQDNTSVTEDKSSQSSNIWLYGLGIFLVTGLGFGYKKLRKR